MRAELRPQKLTYRDYLLFPEDGRRHEIIEGEHFVGPAPHLRHQTILLNLAVLLRNFLRPRRMGQVWVAPIDLVLSEIDVVQPDLVYVSAPRSEALTGSHLPEPPDLVVEVLSPSTRRTDAVSKRRLYEKHGIQEYWMVDPESDSVEVYRLRDGAYQMMERLSLEDEGATLSSPLFPDWTIELGELFQ